MLDLDRTVVTVAIAQKQSRCHWRSLILRQPFRDGQDLKIYVRYTLSRQVRFLGSRACPA